MFLFSVIIPHYNSTTSLRRLIRSIPNDETIQVIVVDDKSTEDTQPIEQDVITRGGIFLHNTSMKKGAGTCRNLGLQAASGKWLVFADADDYFLDNAYDILKAHSDSAADIIYFSPISKYINTEQDSQRHKQFEKMISKYLGCPDARNANILRCRFIVPWSKMIRNRLVKEQKIIFDEVPASNDIMFSLKTAFCTDKIEASPEQIYCVTQSDNSLTRLKSETNFWSRVIVLKNRQQFIREHLDMSEYFFLEPTGFRLLKTAFKQNYSIKFIFKIYRYFRNQNVTIISVRKILYNICPH